MTDLSELEALEESIKFAQASMESARAAYKTAIEDHEAALQKAKDASASTLEATYALIRQTESACRQARERYEELLVAVALGDRERPSRALLECSAGQVLALPESLDGIHSKSFASLLEAYNLAADQDWKRWLPTVGEDKDPGQG